MISGIQMRSPVMRYFLRALEMKDFFTASEIKRPGCSPGRSGYAARNYAAALDSDFFSGLASGFDSGFESGLDSVFVAAFLSAGFLALPLKSVAYQPVPFNWKPAAESCFWYLRLPHAGQTVSGASDTFCRCS